MHSAKFGWNRPNGSGVEDFLISSMYFCYLVIISPLKRIGPFIWTNLIPFTEMAKDARLPEISSKFQICPVNPSSLPDNMSDNYNVKLFADLPVYKKNLTKSQSL